MNKLKDFASIGTADIVGTGISAIFWFYLATLINPDEYGLINFFIGVAGILSYLSLIGTQRTITVYVAKEIPIQSTFSVISIIIGVIVFFGSWLFLERIDVGFLILGYILHNLVLGIILGKRKYKKYLIYVLIQKCLTPILGLGLFFTFGIDSIIFGLSLTYLFLIFPIISELKNVRIDFSLLRPRWGFIINSYFVELSSNIHGQIDKIILLPLLGLAILGNYSLAIQIFSAMVVLVSIFHKYLLSQQASGYNINFIKKMLIIVSIGLTLLGYFIVPIILPTIFPKYVESIDAIRIMSLVFVPFSIVKIYVTKFMVMEKSKYIIISVGVLLGVEIPSMILLGLWYGIEGVATSFVLAISIQALYWYLIDKKLSKGASIEQN
jgi:O-antigen/teichoic acid export membrane protein